MNIVISQPMLFPWVGMFEQIKLCDIYVYYDDVQFSKGSFTNRVQIKTDTKEGFKWLTVPLENFRLGTKINEVRIDKKKNWQKLHREMLNSSYQNAPYKKEMLEVFEEVIGSNYTTISELSKKSIEVICNYYNLNENKQFYSSSEIAISGKSSQRVYDFVKHFNCNVYITGHGALKYLDHDLFDHNGIAVEYMDYQKRPYPQLFGKFNPFVSVLDLIANMGKEGIKFINSPTINWKKITSKI